MKNPAGLQRDRIRKGMAAIVVVAFFLFFPASCSGLKKETDATEAKEEIFAMNTYMRIEVRGREAKEAVNAGVKEIYRLENLLSRSIPESEIFAVNSAAGEEYTTVSAETFQVISISLLYSEMTDGCFDVTVAPLMDLWGFSSGDYRVPNPSEIDDVMSSVGYEMVRIEEDSGRVMLEKKGMSMDLGAVTKGYAGDRVLAVIQQYDIESALINLGGNVTVFGKKKTGAPYHVAIADPENRGEYLGVLAAENQSIVTSGGYERFFESDGKVYIHIMDPETGRPAETDLLSVSVIDADGIKCDILSTALFVMGKDAAIGFWRENPDFGMILSDSSGTLFVSQNIKEEFSVADGKSVVYFE
ncbi:MAG: FAD:protein FMN transferase [Clostridiaceae bacterium]|nr:FAD:protein FMN transferase [Clostridiaceae bacterium]